MSTLKVDGIRSNSASSDAITLANDGTCIANITNRSNRNLMINGAMQVAQRGTSMATGNGYAADRFRLEINGTDENPTLTQADIASGTTPYTLGFRKSCKIQNGNQTGGAGAADYLYIRYKVEAQDITNSGWNYTSASSYITLSFWVKSSVAQNFHGWVRTYDGTAYHYPFETGSLSADTWTKVTKTIPGNSNLQFDNNNHAGLQMNWLGYFGTDYTNNSASLNAWQATGGGDAYMPDNTSTWYTTNDATLELTGVQLEVGSVATDFEHRSFGQELALCQRYYYVLADGSAAADEYVGNGRAWSSSQAELTARWPVVMRSAPSLVHPTGTNYYQWRNGSNETYQDSIDLTNATTRSAIIYKAGTSGLTAGGAYRVQLGNASAYLHFNAEL